MRVLVADDDPVYRRLVEGLLLQWRLEPIVVENGRQAMDILMGSDPPQLVLLDWMMPEMDGYEVCKLVRERADMDSVYILIMTGSRRRDDVMQVLVAGADDYLIKPFDPMDLQIHLRSATRLLSLLEEVRKLRGVKISVGQ